MKYLKKVATCNEMPTEAGYYFCHTGAGATMMKFDPSFPDTWKTVRYWEKEVDLPEQTSMPSDEKLKEAFETGKELGQWIESGRDFNIKKPISFKEWLKSLSNPEAEKEEVMAICLDCRTQYPKCKIRRRCKVVQCDDFMPYNKSSGQPVLQDKEEGEESMNRFCPGCNKETKQIVKLKDPDKPENGEVWQCTICKEHTGWAE